MADTGREVVTKLGSWIAEQQGLDPKRVVALTLHLSMREIPTIVVTMTADTSRGLEEEFKTYKLSPRYVEDDASGDAGKDEPNETC